MPRTTTGNVCLAVFLSLTLTLILVVLYAFYPIISAILQARLSTPETGGIVAVAGGVSESFFLAMVLIEPVLFLFIFALLRHRHVGGRR